MKEMKYEEKRPPAANSTGGNEVTRSSFFFFLLTFFPFDVICQPASQDKTKVLCCGFGMFGLARFGLKYAGNGVLRTESRFPMSSL